MENGTQRFGFAWIDQAGSYHHTGGCPKFLSRAVISLGLSNVFRAPHFNLLALGTELSCQESLGKRGQPPILNTGKLPVKCLVFNTTSYPCS